MKTTDSQNNGEEKQEEKNRVDWRIGFQLSGMLAGIDYHGRHEYKMDPETGYGVGIGAVARFVFKKHWLLHTSTSVSYNSDYISTLPINADQGQPDICRVKMTSISWPIMGGYRFAINDWSDLSFMGGGSAYWTINGKISNEESGKTYQFFGHNGVWRRFNYQICFGYSLEMFDRFMISGICYLGIRNLGKSQIFNYKWNSASNFTLSLAYLFGKDYPKWDMKDYK